MQFYAAAISCLHNIYLDHYLVLQKKENTERLDFCHFVPKRLPELALLKTGILVPKQQR